MGRTKRKHASEDPQSPPIAERIQSEVKKAVEQLENELDVSCTAASVVYDVNDILPEAAEEMGAGLCSHLSHHSLCMCSFSCQRPQYAS